MSRWEFDLKLGRGSITRDGVPVTGVRSIRIEGNAREMPTVVLEQFVNEYRATVEIRESAADWERLQRIEQLAISLMREGDPAPEGYCVHCGSLRLPDGDFKLHAPTCPWIALSDAL